MADDQNGLNLWEIIFSEPMLFIVLIVMIVTTVIFLLGDFKNSKRTLMILRIVHAVSLFILLMLLYSQTLFG